MGLFNKFKNIFKKKEETTEIIEQEEIKAYDKGLEKTRKEFVNELSILGHKYTKVSEEYFEIELKKKIYQILVIYKKLLSMNYLLFMLMVNL